MHKYVTRSLLALFVVLSPAVAAAQEEGKIGITMAFPESVGLVWHATESIAIRPEFSFSFNSTESALGDSSGHSFTTGVSALFYLRRWDRLATYVSPRYAFRQQSSTIELRGPFGGEEQENSFGTHLLSGSFGAQYWLGERFSVFGELGLSYQRGARDDDDDDRTSHAFGTRSGVGIVFYF